MDLMLTDDDKVLAWIELASIVNHLSPEDAHLTFEQRRYLRDACWKQKVVTTKPGQHGFAERIRTFEASKAIFEAVQIFRAGGKTKTEAKKLAAEHFSCSQSKVRDGVRYRRQLLAGDPYNSPGATAKYKNRKLPQAFLVENPDID